MKKAIRSLAAVSAFLLFAGPALAENVDGTWNASVDGDQGAVELQFTFRSEGDRVTGTVSAGGMGSTEITDGRLDGDRLTFNLPWGAAPGEAPQMTIAYEATIDGDEMEIVSSFTGGPGGEPVVTEFTASRAQ